jgi:RNA polymerase sigma-70 factor (ECF subfamily)
MGGERWDAVRFYPVLYRMAVKLTGAHGDAEDVVQDTLCRAWANRHRFVPGTNLRAWLLCILTRVFINRHRRKCLEGSRLAELKRSVPTATDPPCYDALSDEVLSAIDQLDPRIRGAIMLTDIHEQSYSDAARQLGCPIGTVMSRVSRGHARLRRSLGPLHGRGIP